MKSCASSVTEAKLHTAWCGLITAAYYIGFTHIWLEGDSLTINNRYYYLVFYNESLEKSIILMVQEKHMVCYRYRA